MVKKLLTIAFGLMLSLGAMAQWGGGNPTVPQDSIKFWTGTGSNRAVIAVTWDDDEAGAIGIAWGVQWNGSTIMLKSLMDTIAAYDPRFSLTMTTSGTLISNMTYVDSELGLDLVGEANWWWYCWTAADGSSLTNTSQGPTYDMIGNGQFIDWMQMGPADVMLYATDPNGGNPPTPPAPNPGTITADDILYWVGQGDMSALVFIAWDESDTTLAWGVRYDSEGWLTVKDALDSISLYDPRFSYSFSIYAGSTIMGFSTLNYDEGDVHLSLTNTSLTCVWVEGNYIADETDYDGFASPEEDEGIIAISTECYEPVTATPVTPPQAAPDNLCTTVQALPYEQDFSGYVDDQSIRPHMAAAKMPECWTMIGSGTTQYVNSSSTNSTYFGGVAYSTSTNSFGAVAADDAYFCLIASQTYTGTDANHIASMQSTGTSRYAILPMMSQPLSQTVLSFDHRTNIAGAQLIVGYIIADTASFVGLDTMVADNKVLHHDTIHFSQYPSLPADARLTFKWETTTSTASTTGPANRYCGIDNLSLVLDATETPAPVEATIAASDILYWVGTGSNEAILAVNWADTALAWGYRWDGTATVADMMADIAAADPRFSYTGESWLDDILFNDGTVSLAGTPGNYWGSSNNGVMDAGMSQTLANGDLEKWGDPAAGVVVDSMYYEGWGWSYTYVYPMTIHPVSVPAAAQPEEAIIAASDILYWVGEGGNNAILAVNWADTALAWGYRWDGTATVADMMADIAAADPRFNYTGTGMLDDITFNDGTVSLAGTPGNYWGSSNNGVMDAGMSQTLANGDLEKWGDPAAGVAVDSMYYEGWGWSYTYVYPMTIHPVSVPAAAQPEEATIAASDILYWVGEGSNNAILAVNWADTALAWGYRWDGTATVADMMADIAASDPRFSYTGESWLDDILFNDGTVSLAGTPGNYWGSSNNGVMDAGMSQTLANGDIEKWGDPAAGVVVDSMYYEGWGWSYTYVYPMTIHPVSVPYVSGPFCGAVGTEGCNAIKADSTAIVAWATGCTVVRGKQNISVSDSPLADFGTEDNAIGQASSVTTNVISLGDGGMATITFAKPISNGNGPDFAVFENAIRSVVTGGYFLELAFVEVSSDGERFVRFPATSLVPTETQVGTYGEIDPTYINNLAGKFEAGYGTPFDLEELADSTGIDIDSIVYVRIVDVVGNIDPQYATYDAFGHIVNDPWPTAFGSCGFDLAGVAVINEKTNVGIVEADALVQGIYPNPATDHVNVVCSRNVDAAVVYDLNGRTIATIVLNEGINTIDVSSLNSGVYMLYVEGNIYKIVKR